MYSCPEDNGNLDIVPDYASLADQVSPHDILDSKEASIWRYVSLLPVDDPGFEHTPLHQVGWTPIYKPEFLAKELGLENLFIKDESRNPSASFKDRASAVVMAHARQIDVKAVVAASTGNAGAATACMAAAMGMKAIIIAPKTAPEAKVAQLLIYGAQVLLVDGNYDQAFDLSIEASKEFGWYNRNTGFNPYTAEGKKTAAFEIWEQVMIDQPRDSRLPVIFISVGDGNIISGIHKGFKDLLALGWIDQVPRLIGVQAEGSAAIANAFRTGSSEVIPVEAHTIADSISVDLPRDGLRALKAVRQTDGTYITVSDDAILKAIVSLGKVGIFAEPAGATAYAGLVKACQGGLVQPDDPIIVLNTGSGLKDIKASQKALPAAPVIQPTLQALRKVFK
jgi:threonine synthase